MTAESERLAGLYRGWSDEMLVVAATRERGDYEPDAMAAIERELGARGVTPNGAREALHQIDDAQLAHERAAYSRMGGWLFFFALNLAAAVLGGLLGLSRLLVAYQSAAYQSAAVKASCALEAALGAYAGMVLLLFVRHRRSGPFHASAWMCLTVGLTWLFALGTGSVRSPMLLVLTLGTAQAAGWLLYFQRSRRVAVYFAVPAIST
jgi:hypothetical protein